MFVILLLCWLMPLIPLAYGADSKVFRGLSLKEYVYEYAPLMSAVKNSDGNITSYKGFCSDIIANFAEHVEMRLEFVQENATEVAEKGQFNSFYQTVQRKEIDINCVGMAQSLELTRIMDFSSILFQDKSVLMLPWPEEESRLTAVIRPFNFITWIMIIVSSLTFVGFLAVLPIIHQYQNRDEGVHQPISKYCAFLNMFGKGAMYVFAIVTQHGGNQEQIGIKANRLFLRLLLGLWLLMTVILANLYSSTLTSFLTVVKLKPIPNSLEELVSFFEKGSWNGPECLITIMQKGNPILKKFNNSTFPPYRKIGDWVARNPKYTTTTQPEVSNNILQHGCAHMGGLSTGSYRIGLDHKENGKCRMTISKPVEFYTVFTLQLQKDSPYTPIANDFVLRANSVGLIEYWKKLNIMDINMCMLDKKRAEGNPKPIKLIELSSAFFVLGVGIALSAFVFLIERFVHFGQRILSKRLIIIEV